MMSVIADQGDDRETDVRARMVRSAALLFGERGFAGAGLRDVVADSGAPRGSIYHYFPGGKAQLAQEAAQLAAASVAEPAEAKLDPIAALHVCLDAWRSALTASDFRAGSALAAAATAPEDAIGAREAAATAYARWSDALTAALRETGVRRKRAARLATVAVASIEGAVVLCRARRDTAPLDDIGRELEVAFEAAQRR
jgi:AcrR family transcriptional regulator